METKKMNKAKEILYKHAKNNGCKWVLSRNPFLKQAVLNAIDEALTTPAVVERSEQLTCKHDYQPDITCGVDINCCTKCGDVI